MIEYELKGSISEDGFGLEERSCVAFAMLLDKFGNVNPVDTSLIVLDLVLSGVKRVGKPCSVVIGDNEWLIVGTLSDRRNTMKDGPWVKTLKIERINWLGERFTVETFSYNGEFWSLGDL